MASVKKINFKPRRNFCMSDDWADIITRYYWDWAVCNSEALSDQLSQHIHKLTITHHRHHFDGTLDLNQLMWNIFPRQDLLSYSYLKWKDY